MVKANDKTRPFTRLQSTTGGSVDGQPQQHPQQEELLERQQQRRRRRQQEAASGFNRKSREERERRCGETQPFKPYTKTTTTTAAITLLDMPPLFLEWELLAGLELRCGQKGGRPACLPKKRPLRPARFFSLDHTFNPTNFSQKRPGCCLLYTFIDCQVLKHSFKPTFAVPFALHTHSRPILL